MVDLTILKLKLPYRLDENNPQFTYPTKVLELEHIKNSQNSPIKKKKNTIQSENG